MRNYREMIQTIIELGGFNQQPSKETFFGREKFVRAWNLMNQAKKVDHTMFYHFLLANLSIDDIALLYALNIMLDDAEGEKRAAAAPYCEYSSRLPGNAERTLDWFHSFLQEELEKIRKQESKRPGIQTLLDPLLPLSKQFQGLCHSPHAHDFADFCSLSSLPDCAFEDVMLPETLEAQKTARARLAKARFQQRAGIGMKRKNMS